MQFWYIRRHWGFKVGVGAALLTISAFAFLPKKNTVSAEDVQKLIPIKATGLFSSYSAKEMKKRKLSISDFQFDIAANREFAADPRIQAGYKDRIVSHDYLPTGELVEWDYTAEVISKSGDNLVLERRGHGRLFKQDWIEFKIRYECTSQTNQLSSGVVQKDLDCVQVGTDDPWKDLKIQYSNCVIEPLGPRSRHVSVQYGNFKVKSSTRYQRATKETVTVDGDVVCNGERLGMGQELTTTFYTNEEPSLVQPKTGSRKDLYSIRMVKSQAGKLLALSRDELVGSDKPVTKEKPVSKSKPLAKVDSKTKKIVKRIAKK